MKKLNQPSQNWIGCAICLNRKSERVPATVIINGLSVCDADADLASHPGFDIQKIRTQKGVT